jgi:hypothetical protein
MAGMAAKHGQLRFQNRSLRVLSASDAADFCATGGSISGADGVLQSNEIIGSSACTRASGGNTAHTFHNPPVIEVRHSLSVPHC